MSGATDEHTDLNEDEPEPRFGQPFGAERIGVLFDMDGTLVDSEEAWSIGFGELAQRYGGVLEPHDRRRMLGNNMQAQIKILHEAIKQPHRSTQESAFWLSTRMYELFSAGLSWRPGGEELLQAVRDAGMRTALVTATRKTLVATALDMLGKENFDAVITGDDVAQPKPHPEPYQSAARRLGLDTDRCVAIEDSPLGAASAHAAGCVVVVVPSDVPFPVPSGVVSVNSLEDLNPAVIRSLIERRSHG